MDLRRRRLGNSKLQITPVGVGTVPISSTRRWAIYWGRQSTQRGIRAIRTALDSGVNWIDTAPVYGWGRAERIVGKAIKGRRDEVYIFTKCGTIRGGAEGWHFDLRPSMIRKEIERSLSRLQTDYVDLYQMHDVDPGTPVEDSWAEIQKLIDEGKVRYAGLSNHPIDLIERAQAIGPVVSLQERYNPLFRDVEKDIFPYASKHKIGVLAWGPLAQGFLVDGFDLDKLDKDDFRRWRHELGKRSNYEKVKKVRASLLSLAREKGITLVDLVIAWELSHPELTAAIIGVRDEAEAKAMSRGTQVHLRTSDLQAFEDALRLWREK